ncbi:Pol polyprotein [Elysia marginata]|uniref:Pol polyprotein n=1 Tax=Elysia marginata TaxID=1093978 RepID=A0AAV4ILE7_9GAST|nr:Pol polyprotein [Elysia marginata]
MCRLLHIHKSRTTAYRSSANGQAERMNCTLMAAVRSFVNSKQNDWDDYVPLIASAIRSSVNRHTGFTPNKMMLGREVMTPPELFIPGAKSQENFADEHVNQLMDNLEKCYATARKTLQTKLKSTKRDFDLTARKHSFKRGEAVYYLDKALKKGTCSKLKPIWVGPALIMTVLTPYIYKVKFKNRDLKVVNHDSLKPCLDHELPNWIKKEQKHIKDGKDIAYCVCGMPDDGDLMIRCDVCFQWYHGRCVNLTPTQAKHLQTYTCTRCQLS